MDLRINLYVKYVNFAEIAIQIYYFGGKFDWSFKRDGYVCSAVILNKPIK